MKKHKRIKIYTAITCIVILGVIGYFFCYKDYRVNKIINESIECINQKQYNKAILEIDLALDTKPNDEEAIGLKNSVNKYLTAEDLYSKNQLDEASLKVKEISNYYTINSFKEDVDNLKSQINTSIEKRKEKIEKEKIEKEKKEKEIEKQKKLEKEQLAKKEEKEKEEQDNNKNKTTTNSREVKSKERAVSESEDKKVEKNNDEDSNDVIYKKTLTKDEALALLKEKLGTSNKYSFEGISASDLEGIFDLFRSSKTLYAVNLYNGEISDANTGKIYSPAIR